MGPAGHARSRLHHENCFVSSFSHVSKLAGPYRTNESDIKPHYEAVFSVSCCAAQREWCLICG